MEEPFPIILANAFSINMLSGDALIRFEKLSEEQFAYQVNTLSQNCPITSAIGHPATAQLVSAVLGQEIAMNRIPVRLEPGIYLFVIQVQGRLPEGKVLSLEELRSVPVTYWLVTQEQ